MTVICVQNYTWPLRKNPISGIRSYEQSVKLNEKKILFSVEKDDCEWIFTKGTGKGGQKRNKTSSAVYCKHKASGATGYCQEHREQSKNRQEAFKKMASTTTFRNWAKREAYKIMGTDIESRVDEMMKDIVIEIYKEGKWVKE